MQRQSLFNNGELLSIGRRAEDIILDFMRSWPDVIKIEDVRQQEEWQRREIDFRVHFTHGIGNYEAKSDTHITQTGNVVFELARIHMESEKHCAYLGWSVFSEANWLLEWCPTSSLLYTFRTKALREGMQRYIKEHGKHVNINIVESDNTRTTVNILVPLRYIAHNVYHKNGIWSRVAGNSSTGRHLTSGSK